MIERIEKEIDGKIFILSKVPAIPARRIAYLYPSTAIPVIGDYEKNEQAMLELLSYAAVKVKDGNEIRLTTQDVINNHLSWETMVKLEMAMLEYNCSFLDIGRTLIFCKEFVQNLDKLTTQMSTTFLDRLSLTIKQHFTS